VARIERVEFTLDEAPLEPGLGSATEFTRDIAN
jgi:hypothetical protein